ncbi:MAG TPA: transcriptional regulator, partial [Pseudonocardia sp.]|nr:transcriptional regulator [Pseudonocardia sp.]
MTFPTPTPAAPGRPLLVTARTTLPDLGDRVVDRPRVAAALHELTIAFPLVHVVAVAGSGKTTAVAQAVARGERPVAWLTLDPGDTAPGRLLTYLEAALSRVVPAAQDVAATALAQGYPHREAAALLAEAVGARPVLLVLDEVERLAGSAEARSVVAALLRYAPPALHAVLISRYEVDLDTGPVLGRVAVAGGDALAFTVDEAAAALSRTGLPPVDPVRAVAASGGWVTGV